MALSLETIKTNSDGAGVPTKIIHSSKYEAYIEIKRDVHFIRVQTHFA